MRKTWLVMGGNQMDVSNVCIYHLISWLIPVLSHATVYYTSRPGLTTDIHNAYPYMQHLLRSVSTGTLLLQVPSLALPTEDALYWLFMPYMDSNPMMKPGGGYTWLKVCEGFCSCLADPDGWMKPKRKPNRNKYWKYWKYTFVYVDAILVVSHNPQKMMYTFLSAKCTLKAGRVKAPDDQYLSSEIHQYKIEDSDDPTKTCWGMSLDTYIKWAVTVGKQELEQIGNTLPAPCATPLIQGYCPKIDTMPELDDKQANYYQWHPKMGVQARKSGHTCARQDVIVVPGCPQRIRASLPNIPPLCLPQAI